MSEPTFSGRTPIRMFQAEAVIRRIVFGFRTVDLHTHLMPPAADDPRFLQDGGERLCLYGPEANMLYHYVSRRSLARGTYTPAEFKDPTQLRELADRVWAEDFRDQLVTDEGRLGVLTSMKLLGLNPNAPDLSDWRAFVTDSDPSTLLDTFMDHAGVTQIVMTNDPANDRERRYYDAIATEQLPWDKRFVPALRLDTFLLKYREAGRTALQRMGYGGDRSDIYRVLDEYCKILPGVAYVACSFSPEMNVADTDSPVGSMLAEYVLPFCRDRKLPFFLMPGPQRGLNPTWGNAADGAGNCDMDPYKRLIERWRDVMFLITPLYEANLFDCDVMACHSQNLVPIGHWWFNLTPSSAEITLRRRLSMLGDRFITFNSDARVGENLISKWSRYREILAKVLTDFVNVQLQLGVEVTEESVRKLLTTIFTIPNLPRA